MHFTVESFTFISPLFFMNNHTSHYWTPPREIWSPHSISYIKIKLHLPVSTRSFRLLNPSYKSQFIIVINLYSTAREILFHFNLLKKTSLNDLNTLVNFTTYHTKNRSFLNHNFIVFKFTSSKTSGKYLAAHQVY